MFDANNMICKAEKMEQFKNELEMVPRELLFKILIVGDYGVGKTSIVSRYAEGTFSSSYKITIGADFAIKRLDLNENTRINLQLWDIAGHERFGFLTRVYYKYSVAAAIVFDLSRLETFESVEKWISDLRLKVTSPNGQQLPVVLLANKSDVAVTSIPAVKLQMLCKKFNILACFVTSAKENSNIDEAFWFLVHKAIEDRNTEKYHKNENIVLGEQKMEALKKSSCCG